MSVISEYRLPSSDGRTLLHVTQWTPLTRPLRGVVLLSHGVAEYGQRYAPFAQFLCGKGFAVLAHDHLGHGQSVRDGGTPLYFGARHGWQYVTDDLAALQRTAARAFPQVPCFLFGHSMGSFIARTYLIRYPGALRGAILCGTGQPAPAVVSAGRLFVDREIRLLGPKAYSPQADALAFGAYNRAFAPNRTKFDWISANEDNVDAYIADPLCGGDATLGLLRDMLGGIAFIGQRENISKVDKDCALLLIAGDKDPVGDMGKGVERVRRAYRRAGVRDVQMKLYHDLRHEILNERSRRFIYQDVLAWLEAHLPTARRLPPAS